MLQSFSKILQSSLIEYAFHFKRYMLASCANGVKFLLESSSQTYPNHTQNNLVSSLKHAPNILHILLRALQQHSVFFLPYQLILLLIAFLQKISGVGHLALTIASIAFLCCVSMLWTISYLSTHIINILASIAQRDIKVTLLTKY